MSFASPIFFLLLLLFPLAWGFQYWRSRRGLTPGPAVRFANFLALLRTPAGIRARLTSITPILRGVALLLMIVALARPQTEDWETLMGQGLDIMICLDMSGSMNAVDMTMDEIAGYQGNSQEPPNRFQMAKETLKQFVKNRRGDRIGLIVFSSDAYLKFPLTLDYETVITQLDALVLDSLERDRRHPGCVNGCTINGDKTAIGDALAKAYKRLEQSDAPGKLIVLITDGNDNASKLKPLDVARYLGEQPDPTRPGLYSFLVGGGPKSKMPVVHSGRLLRQHGFLSYSAIEEQVDEEQIKEMTEAAQGIFHVSYDEDEFKDSFNSLERSEHLEQRVARHKDRYWPLLIVAAALLLLEFLFSVTILRRYP